RYLRGPLSLGPGSRRGDHGLGDRSRPSAGGRSRDIRGLPPGPSRRRRELSNTMSSDTMSSDVVRDAVAPPLPVGTRLASHYRGLACLTRGKTADVYDVWSEDRDCRCVAKVLRPERRHDTKAQRALLREGVLLGQLSHPHIVRLYEILWKPSPALILETLTGATLSHLIKRNRRLGLADLVPLGIHVCSAMHYLHHRAGRNPCAHTVACHSGSPRPLIGVSSRIRKIGHLSQSSRRS